MKIDIVIKDVDAKLAQQIFALIGEDVKFEQTTKEETVVVDDLPFDCQYCGRKFKSQNTEQANER